jgi:hypothetical protein
MFFVFVMESIFGHDGCRRWLQDITGSHELRDWLNSNLTYSKETYVHTDAERRTQTKQNYHDASNESTHRSKKTKHEKFRCSEVPAEYRTGPHYDKYRRTQIIYLWVGADPDSICNLCWT